MGQNAFINKSKKPTSKELTEALGPSRELWDKLIEEITNACKIDNQEWNSYSVKAGWSLRLQRKKRNILHLGPLVGGFQVALILGDKAVKAARESRLPARAVKLIKEAKRYPEGTAIRFAVKSEEDIDLIKQFAVIKSEN